MSGSVGSCPLRYFCAQLSNFAPSGLALSHSLLLLTDLLLIACCLDAAVRYTFIRAANVRIWAGFLASSPTSLGDRWYVSIYRPISSSNGMAWWRYTQSSTAPISLGLLHSFCGRVLLTVLLETLPILGYPERCLLLAFLVILQYATPVPRL